MSLSKEVLEEAGLISKRTKAVYDYEFIKALRELPWREWFDHAETFRCRTDYLEAIPQWISSSRLNRIEGLERFKIRHLINGTTQTFDEAYQKYATRRLRFFKGEYAYHRRVVPEWKFLEDEPLASNDYVIVSAPFCSTGDVHPQMNEMLDQALRLQVPVIVDCAYFGTCVDLKLSVDHPAIESVSFSLSKGLGLGDIRSGVRFSNIKDKLPISQQNDYDHTVLCAAKIGLFMMNRFSPDQVPLKFRDAQLDVCRELGVTPTKCMHLALADQHWPDYMIDGTYYRVGIRDLVKARKQNKI